MFIGQQNKSQNYERCCDSEREVTSRSGSILPRVRVVTVSNSFSEAGRSSRRGVTMPSPTSRASLLMIMCCRCEQDETNILQKDGSMGICRTPPDSGGFGGVALRQLSKTAERTFCKLAESVFKSSLKHIKCSLSGY
jgi:hypothetical protein